MPNRTGRKRLFSGAALALGVVLIAPIFLWLLSGQTKDPKLSKSKVVYYTRLIALKFKSELLYQIEAEEPGVDIEALINYIAPRLKGDVSEGFGREADTRLAWAREKTKPLNLNNLVNPGGLSKKKRAEWEKANFSEGREEPTRELALNHVKGHYVVSQKHYIWCCDSTERGGTTVTLILDLATRYCLGALYEVGPPKASSLTLLVRRTIKATGSAPVIFHSDNGPAFASKEFEDFLRSEGVKFSRGGKTESSFQNQVVESYNKKLWSLLNLNKKSIPEIKDFASKSAKDRQYLINCALDILNNNIIQGDRKWTAANIYKALDSPVFELAVMAKSNTVEAELVQTYHELNVSADVARQELERLKESNSSQVETLTTALRETLPTEYKDLPTLKGQVELLGKLLEYMASAFRQMMDNVHGIAATQAEMAESANNKHKELLSKLEVVLQEKTELEKSVKELVQNLQEERAKREEQERNLEERRLKRQNAQRKPLRNAIEEAEMKKVLSLVSGTNPFIKARDRVAILILCLFGLRIGNVQRLTKQNISDLYKGKEVEIKLLKDKSNRAFRLVASETQLGWFAIYKDDFEQIIKNPDLENGKPFYKTTREVMTKRINAYFKKAGEETSKNLTSHSARIGVATSAIAKAGIRNAQLLLGHVNVQTTQGYDRNVLSKEDQQNLYDKILPKAEAKERHRGRPRKIKDDPTPETVVQPEVLGGEA